MDALSTSGAVWPWVVSGECRLSTILCSSWWFNCSVRVHEQLCRSVSALEVFHLISIWCHFYIFIVDIKFMMVADSLGAHICCSFVFYVWVQQEKMWQKEWSCLVCTGGFDEPLQKGFMISFLISSSWWFLLCRCSGSISETNKKRCAKRMIISHVLPASCFYHRERHGRPSRPWINLLVAAWGLLWTVWTKIVRDSERRKNITSREHE